MPKVAVLGYGIVGGGVVELLLRKPTHLTQTLPKQPSLAAVLDIRDFPDAPCPELFTKDFATIENNPDITIVVETIGGARIAYDFTKRALNAGKHVVTSNKELVATHGPELLALAKAKGVNYLFEASVGGGIPVIQPLALSLAANRVTEICGIMNGTTNYILTKMYEEGCSMLTALDEAKAKGYAEADPSDDIEGKDTCRKIAILASLGFGGHVYPNYIPTTGISYVTQSHITEAAKAGYAIKLIGRAKLCGDGKLAVMTAPHAVSKDHPFFNVRDVYNAFMITGDATQEVMFYGRGAGRMPTASAVMADVHFCAANMGANAFPSWPDTEGNPLTSESMLEGCVFSFSDGTKMPVL